MTDSRKSGEVIELNQAVWMMEATFNYYHGFTGEDYLTMETDTTYVPVNYSGLDNVPVSELQQIYKQVNNAIYYSFVNYQGENKRPYLFDLELQATPTGSQIAVYTTVGSINTQKGAKSINSDPFDEDDYCSLGTWWGCIEHPGGADYNAEIRWRRALIHHYFPRTNLGYFVSDVEESGEIEPEDYPIDTVPFSCAKPYRLYRGYCGTCFSPNMMNFYYYQFIYIIKDRCPKHKYFVDILIDSHAWSTSETEVRCNIKYGVVSFSPDRVPCEIYELP